MSYRTLSWPLILLASFLVFACSHPPTRSLSSYATIKADRLPDGTFRITTPSNIYNLRFLSSQIFRLHALPQTPSQLKTPELMVARPDHAWRPVTIVETDSASGIVFASGAMKIVMQLTPGDDFKGLSVSIQSNQSDGQSLSPVLKTWELHPEDREVNLSLGNNEFLYGLGDKKGALNQRGLKVQMGNNETPTSGAKNIPFYISSAGYGLFFHNSFPSSFDLGASEKNWITLTGTNGDLDFYFFLGASTKDILAKYNDLTGHPAFLPRWFFGYHQGKSAYGGRDAFSVGSSMREKKLPLDSIFYEQSSAETTDKTFATDLWQQLHLRLITGATPFTTSAGIKELQKQQMDGRPAGLVSAGISGAQRLGWTTTGNDSQPEFASFHDHLRALMNLSLSGFSNIGFDIGGWDHKGADDVYIRWFAAGAFNPFMWAHGQSDHEPYSHGSAVEDASRFFLKWRYKLIPFLYSLHEQASHTGIPMIRAFPLETSDPKGATIDDEFFLGDQLLIAPLFNAEGSREIYLPKGNWHDLFDESATLAGPQKLHIASTPINRIPVFVRSGSIIPMGPAMQYSEEKPVDPISVHFYGFSDTELKKGARKSQFTLYEDDGKTLRYQAGETMRTTFTFEQSANHIRFRALEDSGNGKYLPMPSRGYWIQLHGLPNKIGRVEFLGEEIPKAAKDKIPKNAPSWGIEGNSSWIFLPSILDSVIDLNLDLGSAGN